MRSLASTRDSLLKLARAIQRYQAGERNRRCATCAASFKPHQRYHFFCDIGCRKRWYRGQFRPRKDD